MADKLPWIERMFVLHLPVSMFPNLVERLRGTPARLEDRVRDLADARLRRQPSGRWSIVQHVGHLVEVEALWLGRLDDFDAGLEELRPADMSNQRTEDADYNARELPEVLAALREVRGEFVTRLEALDDEQLGRSAYHARLDRHMTVIDLMTFVAEHDDHHLAAISEILREPEPAPKQKKSRA